MPARENKRTPWQYVLVAMLTLLAGVAITGSVAFASRATQLPSGASARSHPDRPGSKLPPLVSAPAGQVTPSKPWESSSVLYGRHSNSSGTLAGGAPATVTVCPTQTVFTEGFESGTLGQFTSSVPTCVPGGCGWVMTGTAHSGVKAAFAPDLPNISDQRLALTNALTVPNSADVTLSFWHRYNLEDTYDGGVLELSTDNGVTWRDVLSSTTFLQGGYNATISTSFQSPIAGRQAWSGNPNGTSYTQVIVDLAPLAGQSLKFRFREANDNSAVATPPAGWWIDDVVVTAAVCTGPTATATRTPTACATYTIVGAITTGDVGQAGALNLTSPSTCGQTSGCPGAVDNAWRHLDDYYFTNNTGVTQCIIVTLDTSGCAGGDSPSGRGLMHSVSYLDSFGAGPTSPYRPNDLCTNYMADSGASQPFTTTTYTLNVPPRRKFVVVVNEVTPNQGCARYVLTVSGCATLCTITFSDVVNTDYFYQPVQELYCRGAISGYGDNTFRPYNNTTRGQLSKIIVLARGWPINTTGGPHFSDVPLDNPFYSFIETAYNMGVISGYGDGTFRWGNNITRGQLSKVIVLAEGWPINTSGGPHFSDVLPGDTFYSFIETAFNKGVISGYADGSFRPGNNATRGQICKIIYSAMSQPQ